MIKSMTAFASVQKSFDHYQLSVEIKSVNHRYFDLSLKLPERMRAIEPILRTIFREQINRGKVDCYIKYRNQGKKYQKLLLNDGLVQSILDSAQDLAEEKQLQNDISVSHLLAWPEVLVEDNTLSEGFTQDMTQTVSEAMEQLLDSRQSEGQAIRTHMMERAALLKKVVQDAVALASNMKDQSYAKLMSKLESLPTDIPKQRIEQELALLITKMDVDEELNRLHTHIEEVSRVLDSDEPVGRRLDFLMQELNRETNTLGAKSDHVELTQCVVEMKVLIEQMREQIQNVE